MADNKKIITDELLKLQTEKILQVIADSTYQWESYSDEEIGNLVDLDETAVAELTKVINDGIASKNHVYSSAKTKELIQQSVIESNQYSDDLVANLSNIKLDIVDTLPDSSTVNKSTIYILKDSTGGTNNTLNVWSDTTSTFIEVGKLSVDFTNYYDKTGVDSLLAGKANADEVVTTDDIITDTTQATGSNVLAASTTISELDKKVNKSAILSAVSATPSDEKVLSEKATKAELDKKIDKTAISTSISSTSTDEEVASAKCINDNYNIKTFTKLEQLGLTEGSETLEGIIGAMPSQSVFSYSVTANSNTSIYPRPNGMLIINKQGDWRVNLTFYSDSLSEQWIGYYQKSSGLQAFRKVCTTDLQNKSFNALTTETTANYTLDLVKGTVLNGMCTVTVAIKVVAPATSFVEVASGLPKLNNPFYVPPLYNWSDGANTDTSAPLHIVISGEGKIRCELGVVNKVYYVTINYPTLQ